MTSAVVHLVTAPDGEVVPMRSPGRPSDLFEEVMMLPDGSYAARYRGLLILVSEARENDGRWWTHVSVSRKDRKMPTYDNLMTAKAMTLGPDRTAIQLFMPDSEHIDIAGKMPRPVQVLHLWSCADDFPLPDFSHAGPI